jgi:hypothetical protein
VQRSDRLPGGERLVRGRGLVRGALDRKRDERVQPRVALFDPLDDGGECLSSGQLASDDRAGEAVDAPIGDAACRAGGRRLRPGNGGPR